jgi:TRAP-type uncharacterized transport system fused permease subunit
MRGTEAMNTEKDPVDVNELINITPEKVDVKDPDQAVARALKGPAARLAAALAVLFTLFQLYTAFAGAFPDLIQRSIHMGFAVVLAFLLYSASHRSPMDRPSIIDILAIIMGVVVCGYAALNYDRIMMNPGISNEWDLVLGIIATLLVLEMTRRILS